MNSIPDKKSKSGVVVMAVDWLKSKFHSKKLNEVSLPLPVMIASPRAPYLPIDDILKQPDHKNELERWIRWIATEEHEYQVKKMGEAVCYVGLYGSSDDLKTLCESNMTTLPPGSLSAAIGNAARRGDLALVKFFLEKAKIFEGSAINFSDILAEASLNGRLEVVDFLVSKNASSLGISGYRALQLAIENSVFHQGDKTRNFPKTVRCLLPFGDVDAAIASALAQTRNLWPHGLDEVVNELSLESLEVLCARAAGVPAQARERLESLRSEQMFREILPQVNIPSQAAKRL